MPSSQANLKRKIPRKHLRDIVGTVGSLDTKKLIVPIRKAIRIRVKKSKNDHKKKQSTKGNSKGKGHRDMSKIKCFNCGEYGHFARDCLKACGSGNIAQEREQNNKVENMLDLDNTSVCKECVMMCAELQYEDADEDLVVSGDQGINTDEYEKAMYGDLMKTQSEEEEEVKYNVAQRTNDSMLLERKRRQLKEDIPNMVLVRVTPR